MASKLNKYSEEESRKYNGQTVMSVLAHLGAAATAEKICDEIVYMIEQPKEVVEPEVRRILRRGITNGFLVKFGKNYLLSGEGNAIDSKRKTYKKIGSRVRKSTRNIKSVEKKTEQEEDSSIPEEYLSVHKNIALKFDQTDGSDVSSTQMVLLNPKKAVNAIINDLYKLVSSDETAENEPNIIDLEAIISKNLNSLSKPYNE